MIILMSSLGICFRLWTVVSLAIFDDGEVLIFDIVKPAARGSASEHRERDRKESKGWQRIRHH